MIVKYKIIFHTKDLPNIPKLLFLVPMKIYHLATLITCQTACPDKFLKSNQNVKVLNKIEQT
jgi:hypothetical protein